jgi:hypothetical protein
MNPRLLTLFLTVAVLLSGPLALAQVEIQPNATEESLWTDAMYYLKIGRMEYGKSYLQAYIDHKVDPVKTLEFSEKDPRSVQILIKLQQDPQLGALAQKALDQIDQGWQIRRRDVPRIQAEIDKLTGTLRGQFHATERLKEAGEYAVPVMLEYLADANRPALHAKIIEALVSMGPGIIEPLLAAVTDLPENPKLLVINTLGRLDYAQSIPYLKEMIENTKESPTVRSAARAALDSILARNPKYRTDADAAQAFYQLALRYFYHDTAICPGGKNTRTAGLSGDVTADNPNIWLWQGGKLVPTFVPWEIYYDLMTMRLTRRSLQLDATAGVRDALTLWLMADCKRESKLSATVTDPIHGKDFPDTQYFFRCAGTRYCLEALGRSLNDGDIVITLAGLEALRVVASGNDILTPRAGGQPIAAALNHPHQLVRLYAALALGWAAPCDKYPGMDEVVPLLGKALLGPKNPAIVLIGPKTVKRTALAQLAKTQSLQPKEADTFEAGSGLLAQNPADVELIILDYSMTTPSVDLVLARIRENAFLKLVPVIVLVSAERVADAKTVLGKQAGLAILPDSASPQTVLTQIEYLKKQFGRVVLNKAEIARNALLAANALEKLARAKLAQYDVEKARANLNQAMNGSDWILALESARVLSLLTSPAAQQNLADAALARKQTDQKVALLNFLADSVRNAGNKLDARQVADLQTLVTSETDPAIRQATARALGALNLEPQVARKVILTREPFGAVK